MLIAPYFWRRCHRSVRRVFAMPPGVGAQQSFRTAEEAVATLVNAVRDNDRKDTLHVLSPASAHIISSGDEAGDAGARQHFVTAYDAKHRVSMDDGNKAIVVVGQEDFPFPIPLIRKHGMWRFDAAAGRLELLYRRIGRNELDTIQVCFAYLDAQKEYARED